MRIMYKPARASCGAFSAAGALDKVDFSKVVGDGNSVMRADLFADVAAQTANVADRAERRAAIVRRTGNVDVRVVGY